MRKECVACSTKREARQIPMTNPDMDSISWIRLVLAISIVSGLLALLGLGLRYISLNRLKIPGLKNASRRLSIVETLPLDVRNRLVIIRCDNKEHLLLLGSNQDIVVETNLSPPQNVVS